MTASVRVQEEIIEIGDSVSTQAAEVTQDCEKTSDSLEAINDGDTTYKTVSNGPNKSVWSNYANSQAGDNKAELVFRYDTAFSLGEVVMHFVEDSHSATYPAISEEEGAVPEIYVTQSAGDNDWTKVEVESIKDGAVVDNRVKPYIFILVPSYTELRLNIYGFTRLSTTAFSLGEVVMHFVEDSHSATYPAISEEEGAVPEIYVTQSAGDNDWTKVEVESIKDGAVVDNRVKPYIFILVPSYTELRLNIYGFTRLSTTAPSLIPFH